ncbi:MAG: thiamine pyrophosphate-requiring protein [Chloroflexi bacterium]|nr:thiamine pyrophosphate-requiring protein [Chloroflexota bacterium]
MTSAGSHSSESIASVDSGAEAFVELLNNNGVEFLFLNSGTDTFPIQEAIAKFADIGKPAPRVILCPDEATALAAAHGHFMVSRKPQVVMVHVDAGTLQLGGGMHNAQRGRIGIILCAGRAPMTFEGEMDGTRSLSIHWTQEQLDQAGVLRNFTKWDYELRRTENIQHVVQRAFQVASSEPSGPVYLTLPREVLMDRMTEVKLPSPARHGAAITPAADPKAIEEAAELLLKASSPLIITGQSGRNPSTVAALVELAEIIGAPVVSEPVYMNFPSTHPMSAGGSAQPYIEDADVVLTIDQDVPYIPAAGKPNPNARLINIDFDPVKQTIPLWVFPSDLLIHADSAKAVPSLVEAINSKISEADKARIDERFQLIKDRHEKQREEAEQLALSHAQRDKITPEWLSYCINQVVDDDTIVLDESVTNSGNVSGYIERSKPGTFFKSGGSSLGWALGAALGTKLAEPDKTVVTTVGDGAFYYGCPTSTLWAADVHDAPFLTVIYNNEIHNAPKQALKRGYSTSYSEKTNNWVGMGLGPSVDFAMVAEACRAYGEIVTDPAEVKPALERAMEQVRNGRAAVLDVRIEHP